MKREIKFRGKDKRSGEWFYGNLYDKDNIGRTHICTTQRGSLDVIPNTVGQFTGLYDKNGKEIYEGDILVYKKYELGSKSLVVEFKHGAFGYTHEVGWFIPFAGGDVSFNFNPYDKDDKFVVIGNIHDNPELLKGGKE